MSETKGTDARLFGLPAVDAVWGRRAVCLSLSSLEFASEMAPDKSLLLV